MTCARAAIRGDVCDRMAMWDMECVSWCKEVQGCTRAAAMGAGCVCGVGGEQGGCAGTRLDITSGCTIVPIAGGIRSLHLPMGARWAGK